MIEEIDYTQLHNITSKLKEDSESTSNFTIEFIECLMKRYNLDVALVEGVEIEDIPDGIITIIQDGKIPTKEDLLPLNSAMQNYLITELIFFCGMHRIAFYSEDEELEEGEATTFDSILAMREVSAAHSIGSYLIAALTLLNARIPSNDYVDLLTNNFDDSPDGLNKLTLILFETFANIFFRYEEDQFYYGLNVEDNETEEKSTDE